jgi:hypothetical protein
MHSQISTVFVKPQTAHDWQGRRERLRNAGEDSR